MDLSIPNFLKLRNAYKDIYEQYVDDASFLWILRSIAVEQPHYYATDILELEQRIEAQLDGLMTSIDIGWQVCEDALGMQEPGEVFTAMVIATRSHESSKIQIAVEAGLETDRTFAGLASALGWMPAELVNPWIVRFLNGKDMGHKHLGLAACSLRRQDPGEILTTILQREDCQQHQKLQARALRLIGELRRQDCMPAINTGMNADDEDVRFWANWSAALLGHRAAVQHLQAFVFTAGPHQDMAIQLVFRILPVETAREWIARLLQQGDEQIRAVIKAIGVLGDPHAVNWLITKMQEPQLAKLAGEAFANITGVDFEKHQLAMDAPADYPVIPDDDPNEEYVGLDEDENLPYPEVEKVAAIWRNHGQNFIVGRRYFLGRPITRDLLNEKLAHGTQRQRHAAALELALNEHDVRLPNTRARVLAASSPTG